MINLPVLDANDSLLEVELTGSTYFLRMSWNSEAEFWVLSLEDYQNNVIVAGLRVTANTELLGLFRHYAVPAGDIWCVFLDDTRENITRDDFAKGVASLIYLEPGEDVTV